MKHDKDFGMIFQYVKKAGKPIGIMVAVRYKDHLTYGFSLCHKNDTFDKRVGFGLAYKSLFSPNTCPPSMLKFAKKFKQRAESYFPGIKMVNSFSKGGEAERAIYYHHWNNVAARVFGEPITAFDDYIVDSWKIAKTFKVELNGSNPENVEDDEMFTCLCKKYDIPEIARNIIASTIKCFGKPTK